MPTELAYLIDMLRAYERSFTARVIARPPGAIVLDRTLFYPTGGGQLCDLGTLNTRAGARFPVLEVRKSGDAVLHRIGRANPSGAPLPVVGEEVVGEIDWDRRHRHMRLHTAQHLISAAIFQLSGRKTRRADMEGNGGTIDLDGSWPAQTAWAELLALIHRSLDPPREVRVVQVPRGEWERNPAPRSGAIPLPPHVDPVRVVEIDGIDRCPCGGTHVRSTDELGSILLEPPIAQPGGDRVEFRLSEEPVHSARVTP